MPISGYLFFIQCVLEKKTFQCVTDTSFIIFNSFQPLWQYKNIYSSVPNDNLREKPYSSLKPKPTDWTIQKYH